MSISNCSFSPTLKIPQIFICIVLLALFSCSEKENKKANLKEELSLTEKLEQVSDSTKVKGIVVKNLFKSQILAHKGTSFDSPMIIEKVYESHKELWDNCYAVIFGEENASKFNTESGMVEWNRKLYPENKAFFDQRAEELIEMNLDSILENNLTRFNDLVPHEVKSKISILFTPLTGILFGGCTNDQFCIELNYKEQDIDYTIEKGLPHELNHLAYGPFRKDDPEKDTALRQVIDEGLACYFTWVFFDKGISKYEAVENMTEKEWAWYLDHEQKIFREVKPYLDDETGDNPLLRNDKYQLFEDAPKTLYYWLGFRIIERYVKKNGKKSWRDIYDMNVREVLEESGYGSDFQADKYLLFCQ